MHTVTFGSAHMLSARLDPCSGPTGRYFYWWKSTGHAVVAGCNYGQGSSRELAAVAPRDLGLRLVLAKGFARIHLQNLINYGVLPLIFVHPEDYDRLSPPCFLRNFRLARWCSLSVGGWQRSGAAARRRFLFYLMSGGAGRAWGSASPLPACDGAVMGCPPSSDARGRLNVVTPFHHLSGGQPPQLLSQSTAYYGI